MNNQIKTLRPVPTCLAKDNRTLLNSLPPLTGDPARLAHRLSITTDKLDETRVILLAVASLTISPTPAQIGALAGRASIWLAENP